MATKLPFGDMLLAAALPPTTGNYFFVHNGTGSNGNSGLKPNRALASIDTAVGKCTAARGDVIVAMPGHVETVSTANGLDLDVAGIRVIGLGTGGNRPQINLTATAATTRINANNVWVENVRFTGGIDAVVLVLDINGKTDVTLKNIEYRDVTGECTKFLAAADNSDRLTIDGFRHVGAAGAGSTHSMTFNGCDDLVLRNFKIVGNFSTAAVGFITTLSARVDVRYGSVWNQNAADVSFVDTITGSTGQFSDLTLTLTDNAANITEAITGATFHIDGDTVYVVNAVNEKAMLINWTASTDA